MFWSELYHARLASIRNKTGAVDTLRMKAYDAAVGRGSKTPCKDIEQMKGYYRCCVFKWKKQRKLDNWPLITAACPAIAKKHRELPNILRKFMGKDLKFASRTEKF